MARFSATSTPSRPQSRPATKNKRPFRPGPGSVVDIAGRKLKLSPVVDTLFRWMTERHAIHQRRLAGQPWPWTDDPILRQHTFTNVFRIYDRVTQYIISNVIGKGDRDLHETCFRVILFRCFNRISTWELLVAHFGELTWRDFTLPAEILKTLGVTRVRLLSNNPEKVEALERAGVQVVERVPCEVTPSPHAEEYLRTKKEKLGHLFT